MASTLLATHLLLMMAAPADEIGPSMQIHQTDDGTHFGLFGEKPSSPAPTVFVFATAIDEMPGSVYTEYGRRLAKQGWLYVVLDPPCHGRDARSGEPETLSGWADRVKQGEDLMQPFVERCRGVLDWLIDHGYTDPSRVAAGGTSRGGFCALHFTAAEPRVKAVVCVSPVTNPLVLREFTEVKPQQTASIDARALAGKLAGRAIWISIGNDDARVGTDDCISACRAYVAAARTKEPDLAAQVELVVAPSLGHRAIDNAYGLAAEFIAKHVTSKALDEGD